MTQKPTLWIAHSDPMLARLCEIYTLRKGYEVCKFYRMDDVRKALATSQPQFLICQEDIPGTLTGSEFAQALKIVFTVIKSMVITSGRSPKVQGIPCVDGVSNESALLQTLLSLGSEVADQPDHLQRRAQAAPAR